MTPEELERIEARLDDEYTRLNHVAFGDILNLLEEVKRQAKEIKNLKLCMDSEDYYP